MSGPRVKLLLLAILLGVGIVAIISQYSTIQALMGSASGLISVVVVAGIWVTTCVSIGTAAAVEIGYLKEDKPIALAKASVGRERSPTARHPKRSSLGHHVDGCPGCPSVLVVAPQNLPVETWRCQARFGLSPY
jgi:hypothetical protein